MAKRFNLLRFQKEGKGIDKNAPKKKPFFLFWETYFRNFWKFISVNIVYGLFCVPIITNGFANVGITNITRNIAINKHSFLLTDFFETIKSNWKQAAIVGVINGIIYALLFYSFYSYCFSENAKIISIGTGVCLSLFVIFTFMNFYIWTFLITFNYSVWEIYSNSFRFVFINFKNNVFCGLALVLVYGFNMLLAYFVRYSFVVAMEIIVFILLFPSFRFLLIQFFTFPSIKKYILIPYYKMNPNADIEKQRDFGILEYEEDYEESKIES